MFKDIEVCKTIWLLYHLLNEPALISTANTQLCTVKHYPVVCQLQADLYEGIRADAKLLDPPFTELSEGEDVTVHIICQCLGNSQRAVLLRLHLSVAQAGKQRLKHRNQSSQSKISNKM